MVRVVKLLFLPENIECYGGYENLNRQSRIRVSNEK